MNHIVNQIKNPALANDNILHVVGVVSNPVRWHSRYRLFRQWAAEMVKTPGVKLYVVEGVYGDHQPECKPENGEYAYLCIPLSSEIWLKENLINIGVKRLLPSNWQYLCWCDTDLHFRNPQWAEASLRALQTYNVIQPWSNGIAVLADGTARTPMDVSGGYLCANHIPMSWGRHQEKHGYQFAHCGYAWACTRYFWENIEKLIDFCIIGSADHHQMWGMIDKVKETVDGRMCQGYKDMVQDWATKAYRACGGMIGYVSGIVEHGHHGPLKGRKYGERWQILVDIQYNPKTQIAYDGYGVLNYTGPFKNKLTQMMIAYNRGRDEDSISS